jgi:hypothetical protein
MSVTLARVEPSIAGVGDYIALLKPRVMWLWGGLAAQAVSCFAV